ncbi:putative ribosomal protein L6 [Helianthus anomalus]
MDIPEGIEIKIKAKVIEVTGPRRTLNRNFKHLNLDFQLITDAESSKQKLKVDVWFGPRETTAAICTTLRYLQVVL